jgi:hypothetical protein
LFLLKGRSIINDVLGRDFLSADEVKT